MDPGGAFPAALTDLGRVEQEYRGSDDVVGVRDGVCDGPPDGKGPLHAMSSGNPSDIMATRAMERVGRLTFFPSLS